MILLIVGHGGEFRFFGHLINLLVLFLLKGERIDISKHFIDFYSLSEKKGGEIVQYSRERRRYQCFLVNRPVSFLSFKRLVFAETSNLSLAGMKIRSRSFPFTGETYEFAILVNGSAIRSRGRIVRVENQPKFTYGANVSFTYLPENDRNQLSAFL